MEQNTEMLLNDLNEENLESMIYEIRGERVMLDFDLARIYGYETKRFNEQVKNNIEKFPEDFMFQLSSNEVDFLVNLKPILHKNSSNQPEEISRSIFSTAIQRKGIKGGRTTFPYAFTEKGIYMLMTVLRGELAIKQSITLIRLFEKMKNYIVSSDSLSMLYELQRISSKTSQHDKDIGEIKDKLKEIMDNFIDPSMYKQFLFLNGQKIEADLAYQTIYSLAESTIYVIDDYIGVKTLHLLLSSKKNIQITIISDNVSRNPIQKEFIDDFKKESDIKISIIPSNSKCHDRFIVIDYNTEKEKIYLCGSSSKDAGEKATTIMEVNETYIYHPLIESMLNKKELDMSSIIPSSK